ALSGGLHGADLGEDRVDRRGPQRREAAAEHAGAHAARSMDRFRITRFHHIRAPVMNMAAGTSPSGTHSACHTGAVRKRPKCSRAAVARKMSPGRSPRIASGGETRSTY